MRALISLLLVLSLSWVTTGYACQMESLNRLQARCACPHGHGMQAMHGLHVMSKSDAVPASAVAVPATKPCCDLVVSRALDDQQPGVLMTSVALDLPVFVALPTTPWNLIQPAQHRIRALPSARGPPAGSGSRIYLDTARLRI